VRRAFEDKEFVDKFVITRGQVPAINSPEEFAKEIVTDRVDANEVVKLSGMEPQ
jgi:tripartite-type tricarboxylate transporter receptor subunit TctC